MMPKSCNRSLLVILVAELILAHALQTSAQSFAIDWHTIDCGGAMNSTGGAFKLGGTIGQPDASPSTGPMTGGGFSLEGGFWPGAVTVCPLPGDMNTDGLRNGKDIQGFVNCLIGAGPCLCADTNASGSANTADISTFIGFLMQ